MMKCKFYYKYLKNFGPDACIYDRVKNDAPIMLCTHKDDEDNCVCFEPRKTEIHVRQIITNPNNLASVINSIGYSNIVNIIPCNCDDSCRILVLYKEIKNNEQV